MVVLHWRASSCPPDQVERRVCRVINTVLLSVEVAYLAMMIVEGCLPIFVDSSNALLLRQGHTLHSHLRVLEGSVTNPDIALHNCGCTICTAKRDEVTAGTSTRIRTLATLLLHRVAGAFQNPVSGPTGPSRRGTGPLCCPQLPTWARV